MVAAKGNGRCGEEPDWLSCTLAAQLRSSRLGAKARNWAWNANDKPSIFCAVAQRMTIALAGARRLGRLAVDGPR